MRRWRWEDYGKMSLELEVIMVIMVMVYSHSGEVVEGYRNYSVGDSLGWYDKLDNPSIDYQRWADSYTFSLGDFLVFNTDNNHSVIQTYNFTTFSRCDYADASLNDTIEWSSVNPSSTAPQPISVSVPLIELGATYFFSGDYDGEQCQNGQRFQINVTYGQGLPPSLRGPPVDSPAPVGLESGSDESVPVNFDNPKEVSDSGDPPASNSVGCLGESYNLVVVWMILAGIWVYCI